MALHSVAGQWREFRRTLQPGNELDARYAFFKGAAAMLSLQHALANADTSAATTIIRAWLLECATVTPRRFPPRRATVTPSTARRAA